MQEISADLKQIYFNEFRISIEKTVSLNDEEWKAIADKIHVRYFSKNEILVSQEETENYLSFVAEGVLRGFFPKDGDEHTIAFTYRGHYCASLGSFISRKPSRYVIQALSDVVLLSVVYNDMQNLYNRYKSIERWGRIAAEEVLTGFEWRQAELMSFTAEERYRVFVQRSAHLLQQVPQKHIASYLDMTPETFSRLRKRRDDDFS